MHFIFVLFQACTTFNFLNAESRMVAGAFIPPKKMKFNDMGLLEAQTRHKELYDEEPIDINKLAKF